MLSLSKHERHTEYDFLRVHHVCKRKKSQITQGILHRKNIRCFTLCLKGDVQAFIKHEIISISTDILASAVIKEGCIVPVYCFMPNHKHIMRHEQNWVVGLPHKQE